MQAGTSLAGGRYLIEQRLKRTGMADLWLAKTQQGGFSRQVVIKMIHPDLNEQQEARNRFFDEARLASQIKHPHVVHVFDYGEDQGVLFLAMEYIDGFDLDALLARCRQAYQALPIAAVCRMIADAAAGLDHVHSLRDSQGFPLEIVHRDISPHNLLVDSSGVTKIIDFGIVKARSKASKTRTGVIVGKLQYMSPEQLSSEELDARSDIFSLGLVFFEMITLQPRFRGKNLIELFYEIQNPIPDLYSLRPDCPPEIVHAILRSLAPQRHERYQRAYELQQDLESWLYHSGHKTTALHVSDAIESLFNEGSSSTQVGPGFALGSESTHVGPGFALGSEGTHVGPGFALGSDETQTGSRSAFFGDPYPAEPSEPMASAYSDAGQTFAQPQAVSASLRDAYAKASYNAPPSYAPPASSPKKSSIPGDSHTLAQFKVEYPLHAPDHVEVHQLISIDDEDAEGEGETRLLPSKDQVIGPKTRTSVDPQEFLQSSFEGDHDAATNLLRPKGHPLLPRPSEEPARPNLPASAYAPPSKPTLPEPSLPPPASFPTSGPLPPPSSFPASGPLPLVPLQLASAPPPKPAPPHAPPPSSLPPPSPAPSKKPALLLWAILGLLAFLIGLALVLLLASPSE